MFAASRSPLILSEVGERDTKYRNAKGPKNGWHWSLTTRIEIMLLLFVSAATELASARAQPIYISRHLEAKGADEDDDDLFTEPFPTEQKPWYNLENYIAKDSLAFDMVEGFSYVSIVLLFIWIFWNCFIQCGICPDSRLDRRRDLRRIKDGRGVFSSVGQIDEGSDDDSSEVSMEYGDSRKNYSFGEIHVYEADRDLELAAKKFFSKGDRQQQSNIGEKNEKKKKKNLEIEQFEDFQAKTVFI